MKKKILIMIAALVVFGFYVSGNNNYKEVKVNNNNYYAPDFNVKEGNYFIDDKYIKAVSPKTKKSDFVNHFEFYEGSSNLKCNNGTDYVGTGCSLQSKGSTNGSDWNDVIITGDIDGNGINSITDIVKIAMHAKEKEKLTGAYAIAGDVDYDSELLLKDSSRLASYVIGDVEIPLPKETTHKNVIHLYDDSIFLVEGGTKDIKYSVSKKGVTISSFVSENTAVATVSTSGKVTAKKAGSTNIKITASNGDVKTLLVNVTDEILPTGVSLSNDDLSLKINDTKTLTATVSPVNATNKSVKWSSSNSDIVSVDSNGKLTAKGVGTATITVTTVRGGKTATCKVTVYIPVTGISLNKTTLVANVGTTPTLAAEVQPNNATNKNVVWSSSDVTLATVDSNGKLSINGKRGGIITVSATTEDGNFKANCTVKIMNGYTVLINPSHQASNTTVSSNAEYNTEKKSMFKFSGVVKKALEDVGYVVYLSPDSGSINSGDGCWDNSGATWDTCGPRQASYLVAKSNNTKTAYIALHSNASSGSAVGPLVMHKRGKSNSTEFANKMCEALGHVYNSLNYSPTVPCLSPQDYYEPNIYYSAGGLGSAVLIEVGFHDNPVNQRFIENNQASLADGIVTAISNHFGTR